MAEVCWPCVVGLHEECLRATPVADAEGWLTCCCDRNDIPDARGVSFPGYKDPSEITDNTSTGRKRAKALYPIFTGMVCEWAGLKYAGGGVAPIVGCDGNTLAEVKRNIDLPEGITSRGDLHHGPDKNTLNNSPGNVHRICSSCHNFWHGQNNRYYGERPPADTPYLPLPEYEWKEHDPETKATDEEIAKGLEFRKLKNKPKEVLVDEDELDLVR